MTIEIDIINNEKQMLTFTKEEIAEIIREKAAQIWNIDTKNQAVFFTVREDFGPDDYVELEYMDTKEQLKFGEFYKELMNDA